MLKLCYIFIVCFPHFCWRGGVGVRSAAGEVEWVGGNLVLRPTFQKQGAWQDLNFLKEAAGKEEVSEFFQGACSFYIKNKIWNI